MKISVITCTYNRSESIIKTINSVINQGYNNYEHFIIDDGSDDNTFELIKNYKSNKLKYIRLDNNGGQPTALFDSKIFNLISGDFIILLDSDDYIFRDFFNLIIKDFKKYKKNNIQRIGYSWTDNLSVNKIFFEKEEKYKLFNSNEIFNDNYPLNYNNKGFRDYLFVCTKLYWENRKPYFISPKHWYVSQYDISIKKPFNEIFTNSIAYYMNLGKDSVTRGKNFQKYSPITCFTREYIFEEFKDFMSSKYYNYAFFSMIFNFLIFPNKKIKILKVLVSRRILKINRLDKLLVSLILLFFPSSLLYKIKYNFKMLRSKR